MLPSTMLVVDFGVVKHWLRQFCARGYLAQDLQILLEQRRDDRKNVPCNSTNHLGTVCVLARALVVTAFDGYQALVDLTPFVSKRANGLPHD
jgi:hypothetical protein